MNDTNRKSQRTEPKIECSLNQPSNEDKKHNNLTVEDIDALEYAFIVLAIGSWFSTHNLDARRLLIVDFETARVRVCLGVGTFDSNNEPAPAFFMSHREKLQENFQDHPIPLDVKKNAASTSATAEIPEAQVVAPPPFSIFTHAEKWALIAMAAAAGFFSPMTSSIYFPAIPLISEQFGVSISLINLTVTIYLIFQGLSPMFWAPLADSRGRRPVYVACLLLLSITCVALALVPLDKWWLLLVFRAFQASGSASTAVLGSGVVSDIATPQERGGFLGLTQVGPLIGPCIGPIIGGVVGGSLGWRWIFWFMCIISGVTFVLVVLFMPETLRRVVGDGSIEAPRWNRPLIPLIGPYRRKRKTAQTLDVSGNPAASHLGGPPADAPPGSLPPPPAAKQRMNPFLFFFEVDVVFMLLTNGIVYCVLVSMQTTMSLLFQSAYPFLSQSDVGLCFLPLGVGTIVAALVYGKMLDRMYKAGRAKWEAEFKAQKRANGEIVDNGEHWVPTKEEELQFPVERVRLRAAGPLAVIVGLVGIGFGWTLDRKVNIAAPLIFSFICGLACVAQMNSFQTLLIDSFPKQGSSTTAINNFVRCLLGAAISSFINILIDAIGTGWTYVLIGGLCCALTPIGNFVVVRYGPHCRVKRFRKAQARAAP